MKKILSLSALLLASQTASALTPEQKNSVLKVLRSPDCPLPVQELLLKEYGKSIDKFSLYSDGGFQPLSPTQASIVIGDFKRSYDALKKEKAHFSDAQDRMNAEMSEIPFGSDMAKYAMNRFVFSKLESDFAASSDALIRDAIAKVAGSSSLTYDQIKSMPPEQLIDRARNVSASMAELLDGMDDTDRKAVEARINRGIAAIYDETILSTIIQQGHLSAEMAQAEIETVKGFFAVTNSYIQSNGENIKELTRLQGDIAKDVNDLMHSVDQNGVKIDASLEQIGFVQQMLFGKMTPKEQLGVLRQKKALLGVAVDPQLEKQLELTVKIQDLEKNFNKYLSGANDLITIATNLGFKGKNFTKGAAALAKAQTVVSEGANIAIALGQNNYLGVLSSAARLSGAFGSQQNAAARQHAEVMRMLGQIYENQEWMKEKLEVLDQKLDIVIKQQVEVHKELLAVKSLVYDTYKDVMEKLDRVHFTAWQTLHLVVDGRRSDIRQCENFWRYSRLNFRDPDPKTSPSYIDIAAALDGGTEVHTTFRKCYEGMLDLVARPDAVDPVFKFFDASVHPDHLIQFKDTVYAPLYDLVFRDPATTDGEIAHLLAPVSTGVQLERKMAAEFMEWNRLTFSGTRSAPENFRKLMRPEELLVPEAVLRDLGAVVDFALLADLVDFNYRVKPVGEIVGGLGDRNSFGKDLLEKSLQIVNVAIAQQNLIAGDLALEKLRKLVDKETNTDDERKLIGRLLGNRETLLFRNFSRYYFNYHARSHTSYYMFHDAPLLEQVKSTLPGVKKPIEPFEKDSRKGWQVVVTNEVRLPLITPEEEFGRLMPTSDLNALLELRSQLVSRLLEFGALAHEPRLVRADDAAAFMYSFVFGTEMPFRIH